MFYYFNESQMSILYQYVNAFDAFRFRYINLNLTKINATSMSFAWAGNILKSDNSSDLHSHHINYHSIIKLSFRFLVKKFQIE